MTETAETPTPNAEADSALAAIFAQCDARTRRLAEVRPANKAALFDALAAAGCQTASKVDPLWACKIDPSW